jgi:hypothetical protein
VALPARLDRRLLSYLLVYFTWSINLMPVLLFEVWFVPMGEDLVAAGFVLFAITFPLQGLFNCFAFFHHTRTRGWAAELRGGQRWAPRPFLPFRSGTSTASHRSLCSRSTGLSDEP